MSYYNDKYYYDVAILALKEFCKLQPSCENCPLAFGHISTIYLNGDLRFNEICSVDAMQRLYSYNKEDTKWALKERRFNLCTLHTTMMGTSQRTKHELN